MDTNQTSALQKYNQAAKNGMTQHGEQLLQQLKSKRRDMSMDSSLRNFSKNDQIKAIIIKEMKNVYKVPEAAFSDMDFNGKGTVYEQDFFKTLLIYRLPFSTEELQEFFKKERIFQQRPDGSMDFELFKKTFFPSRDLNGGGQPADHDLEDKLKADELINMKDDKKSTQIISDRIRVIEEKIRQKFANNWTSVRKAFLDVDQDYDGFITAEDMAKFYGASADFKDIQTMLKNRDSKRLGKIDFKDFCKWMGTAIEPCEGFYFRHDSVKNPLYENNIRKQIEQNSKSVQKVTDQLINNNLMKTVLEKFQLQWKSIKKAFSDLNKGKTGAINPNEIKQYLQNWGLTITEDQFKDIYDFIDFDKDGKITYEDLQNSVGKHICPEEFLYFRQDIPPAKLRTCKSENCWNQTKGMGQYCTLHYTILRTKAEQFVLGKTQKRLGKDKYSQLVQQIASKSNSATNIILMPQLESILNQFGVYLSEAEKKIYIEGYSTKADQQYESIQVNIEKITQFERTQQLGKIYDQVNLEAQEDEEDEENYKDFDAIASLGGMVQKQAAKLDPITEEYLITLINRDNKLAVIVRDIKKIDKDNNGYVLINELNKIFKTHYQRELEGKTLNKVLRPFSSIQNKQLIDYKKFNLQLLQKLKTKELENYNSTPAIDQIANLKEHIDVTFSPSSPASGQRMGAIASLFQDNNNTRNTMRKSFTEMNQAITKQFEPKKNSEQKLQPAISKIALEPIKAYEQQNIPKTTESPKGGPYRMKHHRENSQSPSPPRDFGNGPASVFGGKSSGFESFRSSVPGLGPLEIIKQRLAYEWKNIYRALAAVDINNSGCVTSIEFQNTVSKNRVYMTREEFKKIQSIFGEDGSDLINYNQLSLQLGLHKASMDFMQGSKAKNLKVAAQKLKAMHVTHNGQFLLDPIQKPPMSERGNLIGKGSLMKSGSTSVLLNNGKMVTGPAAIGQNKGLILKMLKNYDIDGTGLVSTQNLSKVFKLIGVPLENKNLDNYKSGDLVKYDQLVQEY